MSLIDRFQAYADAFEVFVQGNDASVLEPYFTQDAVYETIGEPPLGGKQEGRDAIFAYMKLSLDGFDRKFDSRELVLVEGPEERGESVWMRWRVSYKVGDAPPLVAEGEETASFEGDRIVRLEDRWSADSPKILNDWMAANAAALSG